jgi:inosose dehydratase
MVYVLCELGTGCVDFPRLLTTLDEVGYRGWVVVEEDVLSGMGNPGDNAKRNRAYLRSIGV